ncbi:hypothetical protein, partial [Mesorhizobium sp. M4B.F.Ca.ET.017.02.2.1]|uniref:hypothetical protein n=1 Tax=Mesorhizobium sp. M4B.F.Ca.ET.017.02.2.1 TaxID=2496649 RepID=UPI001AECE098
HGDAALGPGGASPGRLRGIAQFRRFAHGRFPKPGQLLSKGRQQRQDGFRGSAFIEMQLDYNYYQTRRIPRQPRRTPTKRPD